MNTCLAVGAGRLCWRDQEGLPYIDFHLLVDTIVHDQAMRQPNTMRLHGMASNVGIIANIRVVEVGDSVLVAGLAQRGSIDGCEGRHFREI